jgi:hypothetical protein
MTVLTLDFAKQTLKNDLSSSLIVSEMVVEAIDNFYQELGNPVAIRSLIQAIKETAYDENSRQNYSVIANLLSRFTARTVEFTKDDNGNKTETIKNGQWVVTKNIKAYITICKKAGVDIDGVTIDTPNAILREKLFNPMEVLWEEYKDLQLHEDRVNIFRKAEKSEDEKEIEKAERADKSAAKLVKDKEAFPTDGIRAQVAQAEKMSMSELEHLKVLGEHYIKSSDSVTLDAIIAMFTEMKQA